MKRKKQLKELKRLLKESKDSNLFYTDHVLEYSGFLDFYFKGVYKGKEVVWNATLISPQENYLDRVRDTASTKALEVLPEPEGYKPFAFIPLEDGTGRSKLERNPEFKEYSDKFDKLQTQFEKELFDSGSVEVPQESVSIDEDYKFGVGLHITKPFEEITVDFVEDLVRQLAYEPKPYEKDSKPMTCEECGIEFTDKGMRYIKNFSIASVKE